MTSKVGAVESVRGCDDLCWRSETQVRFSEASVMRSLLPAALSEFTVDLWAFVENIEANGSTIDQFLVGIPTTSGTVRVTYNDTISISRCTTALDTLQQIPVGVWTRVAVTATRFGHVQLFLNGVGAFSGMLAETSECATNNSVIQLGRGTSDIAAHLTPGSPVSLQLTRWLFSVADSFDNNSETTFFHGVVDEVQLQSQPLPHTWMSHY
jgi:hypothetical protein